MKVYNFPLESNVTLNSSFNSSPMQLYDTYGYFIQATWTGTPNGTFKLQCSGDPVHPGKVNINPNVPTNWTDIANSSIVVSAAGNYAWNVTSAMYTFVRLVYTDSSGGTSTAILTTVTFNSKGV